MKKDQAGQRPEGGFGHSLPSKVVSCVASAALATMMVPAVALADGDATDSDNGNSDSELVKDLDGNGKIDVLLVGNSHAGDMTQYAKVVADDATKAGIDGGKAVDVTVLAPMGGRRLYTDDAGRGSHIAAATMDEADYSAKHTDKDSKGNTLAQNKSRYDSTLNASNKTYDLVVLQDWHESTNDSDSSKAATGVANAVKWIKGSNYKTIQANTKVAWAADWPDVANHESHQSNMAGAYNAVQSLTEDKPDFIVPVGTAIENSRSSYFGSVKNAADAYITGSENTEGVNEEVKKYDITARDANHLSYELGCYTASATLVGSVLKAEGIETAKIVDALKTEPVTAEANTDGKGNAKDVPHEWKGSFTDSTWDVVKESVGNALDTPGKITQSKYKANPAYDYADAIQESNFSTIEEAAAKATNREDLENAAKDVVGCIKPDIVKALGLTDENMTCSYSAPINGTADNPTGTAGSYSIKISFLYGYTKMDLTIASGKIKPTYADGGQEAFDNEIAKIKSEIEEYAKAFGYADNIQELENSCFEDCYTIADVVDALNAAARTVNDETGIEDGGYITDNGWDKDGNPVGNWTGTFWKVTGARGFGTIELFGKGEVPAYSITSNSLDNGRIPWKAYMRGFASKIIVGGSVSIGYLDIFFDTTVTTQPKEIVIEDGAVLRKDAIYLNTLNSDLNITFEGSATVEAGSINWYTPQLGSSSRVYVYADSGKLLNTKTEHAWGTNPFNSTTKNSEGYPIVTFVEQGKPSDGKAVLMEKTAITNGGWDEEGNALGEATGVYCEIYKQNGETVLEFSGEGDMPAYTANQSDSLYINRAPWRSKIKPSAITKIIAGGNIGYTYLCIWDCKYAKEITFGDNVRLKKSALHYNAGIAQDVKISFEGKVSAEAYAICIDYERPDGSPKPSDFKGQFTFLVDGNKTFNLAGEAIKPSEFISGNISKTNAYNECVGSVIDSSAAEASIVSEGVVYSGGWDKSKNPITNGDSKDTGVRYKVTTNPEDNTKTLTLFKDPSFEGSTASTPDYWATGSGDENFNDSRIPWLKKQYDEIVIESGIHVGTMALHVGGSTPAKILVKDGASLGKKSIYYNSVGTKRPIVIFEGSAELAKNSFCSWNMGGGDADAEVAIYGDLNKLTINGKAASAVTDFSSCDDPSSDKRGKFVFHSYDNAVAEALEKVESWNGEVTGQGLCASNADDDVLSAGVKTAVETQIGASSSNVAVVVKRIVKGYYEITLSKNVDGTTLSKTTKKQVTFEHNWGYDQLTGSALGFKETCENCGQSVYAELVASDSSAVRDNNLVKFIYNGKAKGFRVIYSGTLSTGNNLKVVYKDAQGNELAGAPTAAGDYTANVVYGTGNNLPIPFVIERSTDLSVSANSYDGIYDGKSHTVTPVIKGGDKDNKVTYSTDGNNWSSDAPSIKDAGKKTVTVKVENPNFQTASYDYTLVVGKKALTVSADNKTMTAGDKLPELTYAAKGFVDGEGFDSIVGAKKPTLSCTADGKTVGTFDIVASGADAGDNYDITYVSAKLTVKAAPATPSRPSNPTPTPTPTPMPAAPSIGDVVTAGESASAATFKVTAVAEASGMGGEVEYAAPTSAAGASSVTVPESVSINGVTYVVTSIAPEAFKGNDSLTSINIPATVVKIGAGAFEGCTALASVKIPVGVKTIEPRTFKGCSTLKSVTTNATRIDASAFAGCSKLAKVKAPKVKVIGKKAFKGDKKLKSLTTGTALTTIGASAFAGNKALTSITVTSKHLSKAGVKGSLTGSAVESVTVRVGTVKANKTYAKKYAKLFTKKVAGKKATVTASKKPLKK